MEDTDINGSLQYLGLSGAGGEEGGQKCSCPHAPPPNRGNTVPYLPKIYGKPCTWWQ